MSKEFCDGNTLRKVANILKNVSQQQIVWSDTEPAGLSIHVHKFSAAW